MNGFTNALLSVLLGWLKSVFNAIWQVLDSDGGGSFLSFLRDHWKVLLLVLCAGGVIVDGLVYLFRWRPYYLWFKRDKKKKTQDVEDIAPVPAQSDDSDWARQPVDPFAPPAAEPTNVYAPPASFQPDPTAVYAPPPVFQEPPAAVYAPPPVYPQPEAASAYAAAPAYQASPYQEPAYSAPSPYQQTDAPFGAPASGAPTFAPPGMNAPLARWEAQPAQQEELRFDDEPDAWQDATQAYTPASSTFAPAQPTYVPLQRMPDHYLQDVQGGFAPPPTPEQLYRRREGPVTTQVHPGLDRKTLLENIGLLGAPPVSKPHVEPPAPTFAPFSATQSAQELEKPHGFGKLARKARTFVGGVDEDNPLSIHDLQSTVDVRTAFHAPVYPKKRSESEDE